MRSEMSERRREAETSEPKDLDFRRIQRSLEKRRRYRYVSPIVLRTPGGYRIQSPCCSRNIDPDGGVIDIAMMLFEQRKRVWRLLRKDHSLGVWELDSEHTRLAELLGYLNEDADRRFWQ